MIDTTHPPAPAEDDLRRQVAETLPEGAADDLDQRSLELLQPELALGGDDRELAANAALRAIARCSRAYLIYDARNEIIQTFLRRLQHDFDHFTHRFGDLALEVRPFELVLDGAVVYLERDRERSLAFKLFRDGVRRLTIRADVTWLELTRLLEILSIRYIGVRLDEDDVLTLLWKAGFQNIAVEAVEGFIEDDEPEVDTGTASGAALAEQRGPWSDLAAADAEQSAAMKAPPDFDLPAPELPDPVEPRRMFLPEGHLDELREELDGTHLADHVLRVIDYLLRAVADPVEPITWEDVRHFMREARDFLMSEGEIDEMLRFRELMAFYVDAPEIDEDTRAVGREFLASFTDGAALRRVLRSIPLSVTEPPEHFRMLLARSSVDPVQTLCEVLTEERSAHLRQLVRQLLEGHLPAHADRVLSFFRASRGDVAADFLRVLTAAAPEKASGLYSGIARGDDEEVKVEVLRQMIHGRLTGNVRSLLTTLLAASEQRVRIRALKVVAIQAEKGAFPAVVTQAHAASKAGAQDIELEALGKTLAHVDPHKALAQFEEWSQVHARLGPLLPSSRALREVAIGGICEIVTDESSNLLRLLAARTQDAELKDRLRRELRRRARRIRDQLEHRTGSFDAMTGVLPTIGFDTMDASDESLDADLSADKSWTRGEQ